MNIREQFDLCENRGYLPQEDPAMDFFEYPHGDVTSMACYSLLNDCKQIPKLLATGQFRNFVDRLPRDRYLNIIGVGDDDRPADLDKEMRLAMNLLSFMAHALSLIHI